MHNFHCFGCGCNIDIIDAYVMSGLTYSEAAEKLFGETGVLCSFGERGVRTKREYRYPTEVPKGDRSVVDTYYEMRKISAKTLDHCDVRQDAHGNVVFNYYDTNDVLTMVKYRPSHKVNKAAGEVKNWCQKDADTAPLLFNMNKINVDQPLLITEGESDCMAAIEAGFLNAVSVPLGAHNTHWIEYNLEWLDQFSDIIICSDNDDAGKEMAKIVCPRLGSWRTKTVEIPPYWEDEETGTKHRIKDLNELLYYGGHGAVMDAIINAKEAQIESIVDLSDVKDINIADIDGVYFGVNDLDKELFKLFYGTLTLVTGRPGCVSCDTEFFNGEQWKRIDEYTPGDKVLQYNSDGSATLVEPLQYHKYPCNRFWNIRSSNGAINQLVSDEHNLVCYSPDGVLCKKSVYEVLQPEGYLRRDFHDRFITTFRYNESGIDLTDVQIKIMCAVICNGVLQQSDGTVAVMLRESSFNLHYLLDLLNEAGIIWTTYDPEKRAPYPPRFALVCFKTPIQTKLNAFDSYWYQCSQHQLEVVADELLKWGWRAPLQEGRVFDVPKKTSADFLQFVYSSCGFRTSIDKSPNGSYRVRAYRSSGLVGFQTDSKRAKKIQRVLSVDGFKYCFSVPSGMLVLRYNDTINITGNSGKTSFLYQIICNALEQRKNAWIFSRELPQYMTKAWMNYLLAGPRNVEQCEGRNGAIYYRLKNGIPSQIDEAYRGQWSVYKDDWPNDIDEIKSSMEAAARRCGSKVFLIDNLMMVDLHSGEDDKYEKQTQFVSWLIQFAARFQVAVILVAHPRKMQASGGAVDLYDISGSSNLVNLAHRTLSLRRVTKEEKENSSSPFAKYSCVVSVTKDRMRGRSGFEMGLFYDDASRRFYSNYEEYDRKYRWDANTYNNRLPCANLDDEDEVYGSQQYY